MKVWIDILTPKQALFFKELSSRLEEEGHEVLRTTRRYREVNQLLEAKGLSAKVVGEHGGPSPYGKLTASVERMAKLAPLIKDWGPDAAVSFSSVEASRVAFGLRIPHYCVSDSPHAEAASRLSIPLSKKLFSPFAVPKRAWLKYGVSLKDIIVYRALDPAAWLRKLKPDGGVLSKLGLSGNEPIVTVRPEEAFAAYLSPETLRRSVAVEAARLLEGWADARIVVLPRYEEQVSFLKKEFSRSEKVKVPETVIDGPSLLAFSSVLIGAGGTVTAEAALLGTPAISCFPSTPTYVEKFLLRKGLIKRSTSPKEAAETALNYLENRKAKEKAVRKAKKLLSRMEDPIEVIVKECFLSP